MIIENIEFEELNSDIKLRECPLVSIFCVTFNHIEYIKDCFEGFLRQNTDFIYEVVVFDDASNDGTTDIVRLYCEQYPKIFHAFIAKENIYRNPLRTKIITQMKYENLRGEYAAMCEGDDYWIDCNKLQMQIDFLRDNSDYVLTMHNARRINYSTGEEDLMKSYEASHEVRPEEVIEQKSGIWPTASMVGRKEIWFCNSFFFECGIGDWPVQLYAAACGKIYYFENVMSVYRYMLPGSWSANTYQNTAKKLIHCAKMVFFLELYDEYTNRKYHDTIVGRKNGFYYSNIYDEIEVDEIINIANEKSNLEYVHFFNSFIELYRQITDINYVKAAVNKKIYDNKHVFIMGRGKYSELLTKQLRNNNVSISGYVLSDAHYCEEEGVLPLSEMVRKFPDALILVGIGPSYYTEVLENLKRFMASNYVFPFVVDSDIKDGEYCNNLAK